MKALIKLFGVKKIPIPPAAPRQMKVTEILILSGAGAASAVPASRWRVAGRGVPNRYIYMATQIPFFKSS